MTQFHVFLPPIHLSHHTAVPRVKPSIQLIQLKPPSGSGNLSQSSLSQRQDRLLQHVVDLTIQTSISKVQNDHGDEPYLADDGSSSANVVAGPSKRRRSDDHTSRRRSGRFAPRTTESLLGTLPQIGMNTTIITAQSDSYSSLNTTGTNQSQLPPTAIGNETLAHLPQWRVQLNKLTPLSLLLHHTGTKRKGRIPTHISKQHDQTAVSVIVCVMSVEQAVMRQRKDEKRTGKSGSLWIGGWRVTAPPEGEEGDKSGDAVVSCQVKLWDSCARDWGDDNIRKGDVVLLENVEFRAQTSREPAQLILSPTPNYTPRPIILYRTLPRYKADSSKTDYIRQPDPGRFPQEAIGQGRMWPEDRACRPDLRLARSDAGVRKVAEITRWFADWVGGEGPP